MKYLCIHIVFFSLLSFTPGTAQSVVSSAGDYSLNEAGSLSWTIGEVCVETLSSEDYTVCQGFQQGDFTIISLQEEKKENQKLLVYPNPAENGIRIKSEQEIQNYRIYNIHGQLVLEGKTLNHDMEIDLSNLSSGEYILKAENAITHKIIKK